MFFLRIEMAATDPCEIPDIEKRPQFGNRFLTDSKNVFEHNAWDNVEWGEEQEAEARAKVCHNSTNRVDADKQDSYETEADRFWDEFYTQHQNRFFKDRHWLFTEFPELATVVPEPDHSVTDKAVCSSTEVPGNADHENKSSPACNTEDFPSINAEYPGSHATTRMFEVGCGVGNTVFPVLKTNNDSRVFMYCCDLSSTAVQLVKKHLEYDTARCHAFVGDVTQPECAVPFPPASLDVIVLIFVLSAIHPDRMADTVRRLSSYLRPGGLLLFRDYGRYDLAQLRFKDGQCLTDNFYVRGDGTRVYFFTQDELHELFTGAGLVKEQNVIDRRLQVNRGKQLKMYRVWSQCKYRKPLDS